MTQATVPYRTGAVVTAAAGWTLVNRRGSRSLLQKADVPHGEAEESRHFRIQDGTKARFSICAPTCTCANQLLEE